MKDLMTLIPGPLGVEGLGIRVMRPDSGLMIRLMTLIPGALDTRPHVDTSPSQIRPAGDRRDRRIPL